MHVLEGAGLAAARGVGGEKQAFSCPTQRNITGERLAFPLTSALNFALPAILVPSG